MLCLLRAVRLLHKPCALGHVLTAACAAVQIIDNVGALAMPLQGRLSCQACCMPLWGRPASSHCRAQTPKLV